MKSISIKVLLLGLLISPLFAQAQFSFFSKKKKAIKGSGVVISDVRNVNDFNKISVSQSIDVHYTQGAKSVKVVADDNIIDRVETIVRDNRLVVKMKKNTNFKNVKKLEVHVSSPDLRAVSASSSSDFYAKKGITTDQLTLSSSSSGDIEISTVSAKKVTFSASSSGDILLDSVEAKEGSFSASSSGDIRTKVTLNKLSGSASSSGDLILSGSAKEATLRASSGGDVEAFGLTVRKAQAVASSGANIEITVKDSLTARASSGADINYKGKPTVEMSRSSGGDVSPE